MPTMCSIESKKSQNKVLEEKYIDTVPKMEFYFKNTVNANNSFFRFSCFIKYFLKHKLKKNIEIA